MPAYYEITFLPRGRVWGFAGSCGNYYEFADGSHLGLHTEPVWCPRCGKVTHGESIPSVEQLDKKLADFHDPTSILYRSTMRSLLPWIEGPGDREKFRQERIKEIHRRREWRLTRRSPAKCIHCGCTEIISLPHDKPVAVVRNSKPFTLISRCVGMCSMNPNDWYFTSEGDRIPRPS